MPLLVKIGKQPESERVKVTMEQVLLNMLKKKKELEGGEENATGSMSAVKNFGKKS